MFLAAIGIWVMGLVTLVPYGVYSLFFEATREEYAFWIGIVAFWLFGYWSVVVPTLTAWKVYGFMRDLDKLESNKDLQELMHSEDTQELAIELIAAENRVPRFVARRMLKYVADRLAQPKNTESLSVEHASGSGFHHKSKQETDQVHA